MSLVSRALPWRIAAPAVLALAVLSCSQYEYTSPDPGIIDVRLKVVNSRQDLLPFFSGDTSAAFANMAITMNTLYALQAEDVQLPIYSDLHAIRRNPEGDEYSVITPAARDSQLVLGQAYAPPQTFLGLQLNVSAPEFVFISYGFYGSLIPIDVIRPYVGIRYLEADIPVQSGRVTRVTIAFDLDQSLIQRTETFLYRPVFYISSVEIL